MIKRRNAGYVGGLIGILGNLIIFLIKLYMSYASDSISILADAFHTFSDMATSMVVVFGFYFSYRKADKVHPFGHGRAEYVASLIISIVLVGIGLELVFDSYSRMNEAVIIDVSWSFIALLLVTILGKEVMALVVWKISKTIDSISLRADTWHHHSDALSTVGVIFALILTKYGVNYADVIMGTIIALILIVMGLRIAKESMEHLIGKIDLEMVSAVKEIAESINGVINVHSIEIHDYGHIKYISLHVVMMPDITLHTAHQIATKVEKALVYKFPDAQVSIHMEPYLPSEKSRIYGNDNCA